MHQPLGALASFRSLDGGSTDPNAMYEVILQFWREVKLAFPDAWGLPPEQSRLMHSAGIAAIGALMDHLMPRATQHARSEEHTSELQSLMRISYAVFCLKKKKKT